MTKHLLTITALATLIMAVACVRTGGGNPIAPGTSDLTMGQSVNWDHSQTHLWGYYDVYIDIPSQTATAVLNREAMFTANVTTFINGKPAALGFHINETPIGAGYVDVDIDVSITHPFPGMPQYHGYDVRGVFMGDGSASLNYNPDLIYPVLGFDQYMLADPVGGNGAPDGYTRWFNLPEFSAGGMPLFQYTPGKMASPGFAGTSTLNPYRYFADGLGTNDDLWTWLNTHADQYGRFSSGATNTRNYYLRFPNAKGVKYGYAVIANWEGTDPQNHPSNAPEAVACSVIDTSDLYYVNPANKDGNLILDISPFGWASQPPTIFIESTVLSSVHQLSPGEMTPVGAGDHYSTYHVEIPADNLNGTEGNEFWVIAEYGAFNYTNAFGSPNDAWEDPLAAVFRYDLYVSPDAILNPVSCFEFASKGLYGGPGPAGIDGDPIPTDYDINFNASCSEDAVTYDWDFDGDGIYEFTCDTTPERTYAYPDDSLETYPVAYQATLRINGDDAYVTSLPIVIAKSIYVDGDHVGTEDGTQANPYMTITGGLGGSVAGCIVRVDAMDGGAGYYQEQVNLKSDVSLIGDNWNGGTGRPLVYVYSGYVNGYGTTDPAVPHM
jgi:hypothetical protein